MPYTIDGSAGSVPQQVLDYYKSRAGVWAGGGQNSFTDAQGFSWIPIGEDDGIWRGSDAFGRELPITGFRRAQQAGSEASKIGENDHYFKPDGSYSHTSQNEKVESGLQQLAQLAAAVGGIGFLGGLAGVPMGFGGAGAGAAGGGLGSGSGAFVGEGLHGAGVWGADGALIGGGAGGGGLASSGLGSSGTGLSFGNSGLGLNASAGQGLTLGAGPTTGITGTSAGASSIGGGLGSGFAGGSGSLLGPAALNGTYTMANGSIIPTGAGAAPVGAGGAGGAGTTAATGGSGTGGSGGLGSLLGGSGLGQLAPLVGGLLGSQGQNASTSNTRELPEFLQGPVANDLVPRVQSLLASQTPQAQQVSNQLLSVGGGLLGQTAGATNPHMTGVADELQRRTQQLLAENNLQTRGNAIMGGALGGSRQGVQQGISAGRAADTLQGHVANLNYNQFNADRTHLLNQQTLGAGMLSQGLQSPWSPIQNTANAYSQFTGFGNTTQSQQSGGGVMGALGGALGAAQFANNMGWMGGGDSGAGISPPNPFYSSGTSGGWW